MPTEQKKEGSDDVVDQVVAAIMSLTPEEQDAILSKLEEAIGPREESKESPNEEKKEQMAGQEGPVQKQSSNDEYIAKLAM